jgi:hypothetical protein
MGKEKLDTKAIGLDTGLALSRWLTGAEHLHYGLWTGLTVAAGNVGAAQDAYSARLFAHLPSGKLRILDIGGGAGETAKKLIALGHRLSVTPGAGVTAGIPDAAFAEAAADLELMCANCEAFNEPASLYAKEARRLREWGAPMLAAAARRFEAELVERRQKAEAAIAERRAAARDEGAHQDVRRDLAHCGQV